MVQQQPLILRAHPGFLDKVRMLGALVLCSSEHVFCCTLLTLQRACGVTVRSPALRFCGDLIWLIAETCWGFILTWQCQEAPNVSFGDQPEMDKACGLNFPFLVKPSGLFDHFITSLELELLTYLSDHRLSRDL